MTPPCKVERKILHQPICMRLHQLATQRFQLKNWPAFISVHKKNIDFNFTEENPEPREVLKLLHQTCDTVKVYKISLLISKHSARRSQCETGSTAALEFFQTLVGCCWSLEEARCQFTSFEAGSCVSLAGLPPGNAAERLVIASEICAITCLF